MINALHISAGGDIGGIETLFRSVADSVNNDSLTFCFFSDGITSKHIKEKTKCKTLIFINHRFDKKQLKCLEKYISENKIQRVVLHSDTYYMFLYFLKLMKKFPNLDYYFVGHNCKEKNKFKFTKKWLGDFLINLYTKKVAKKINQLICVSEAGKESYVNVLGVKPEKISVIYNGIPDNFAKINFKKANNKKIVFLYAGRFEKTKGILTLLESFKQLNNKIAELVLVGDGSLKRMIEEEIKGYPNIKCFQKTDKIKEFYKNANYFVYPSTWEVFGISIVEAMAFGVVPIVNNAGGIPEVVSNKEGFIINASVSREFLKTLENAICVYGTKKYEEYKHNSILKSQQFTISAMIENYENVFNLYKKER